VSTTSGEILDLFQRTGAYLRGHFRLTSGLHSAEYLQCALVLQHPAHAEELGRRLAAAMMAAAGFSGADTVVSPAIGGLIIGQEAARALGARHIFAERDGGGKMTLRRGFAVAPGERCVVVEDVVTTGGSSLEVVELLAAAGARVLATGSIIDRGGAVAKFPVPRAALAVLNVAAWPPESCPLCAAGAPVVKPGSRPG
jgi:orotate phosphoribosyltransferase